MGHGTTVVIQGITRPDAAIGIIESVIVGVEVTLFPFEMQLDDRPHFFA